MRLLSLGTALLAGVSSVSAGTGPSVTIEAAIGSSAAFTVLSTVEKTAFEAGASALREPLVAVDLSDEQVASLYSAASSPVRFKADGLISALPACSVIDAAGHLDLSLVDDSRALQVRGASSSAGGACKDPSFYSAVPQAKRVKKLSVYASSIRPGSVQALPAVITGKGLAFPGQAEVTEKDAMLQSGNLDAASRASLEEQMRAEKAKKEHEEKSFIAKYWHLLLPVGIIIVMQNFGGGGGAAQEGGESGGQQQQRGGGGGQQRGR